ncbi:hypothetical protein GDO81_026527 [Engystomops pustulosus]|uniref:Extensin-like n=1 Tax=Engystomops pustulosus TaxID=76066 RepID=A0AAV6ZIP7_ENGPU|nr:hypothetical protein GDO81_026527 [Engystomops pustulosus]
MPQPNLLNPVPQPPSRSKPTAPLNLTPHLTTPAFTDHHCPSPPRTYPPHRLTGANPNKLRFLTPKAPTHSACTTPPLTTTHNTHPFNAPPPPTQALPDPPTHWVQPLDNPRSIHTPQAAPQQLPPTPPSTPSPNPSPHPLASPPTPPHTPTSHSHPHHPNDLTTPPSPGPLPPTIPLHQSHSYPQNKSHPTSRVNTPYHHHPPPHPPPGDLHLYNRSTCQQHHRPLLDPHPHTSPPSSEVPPHTIYSPPSLCSPLIAYYSPSPAILSHLPYSFTQTRLPVPHT